MGERGGGGGVVWYVGAEGGVGVGLGWVCLNLGFLHKGE